MRPPKRGEKWVSVEGARTTDILSYSAGLVKHRIAGELGTCTVGIITFLKEYKRK